MNELEQKILDSIHNSGFPTELMVAKKLRIKGWDVQQSKYYLDKDENKGRELDISAFKREHFNEYDVGLHLEIEVKKSVKKPWVIFSSDICGSEKIFSMIPVWYCNIPWFQSKIIKTLLNTMPNRLGRTFSEAFKSYDEQSVIFGAMATVTKAVQNCLEDNKIAQEEIFKEDGKNNFLFKKGLNFIEPVVVLNGLLYEAFLDDQNEIKIIQTNYMPVRFGYKSNSYGTNIGLTHIVTLEHFDAFISNRITWLKQIGEKIGEHNVACKKEQSRLSESSQTPSKF